MQNTALYPPDPVLARNELRKAGLSLRFGAGLAARWSHQPACGEWSPRLGTWKLKVTIEPAVKPQPCD